MSDANNYKCPCKECGNNLEFSSSAAGTTITCPHCGQWTELTAPEEPSRGSGFGFIAVICFLVLACGIGAWFYFSKTKSENAIVPEPKDTNAVVNVITPTNLVVVTQAVPVIAVPKPKSAADLKVGKIVLEKTPGNSLVYAIGTVKNDSAFQRFGVKVELDLFNREGTNIGSTQDYKDILEPHQDWRFRALIPEKRAVSAKLSSLKEQE